MKNTTYPKNKTMHLLQKKNKVTCEVIGTIEGGGYEKMYEEIRRVYSSSGISPTITTKRGGHHEVKIAEDDGLKRIDVPQMVKVRKHTVDTEKLGAMLRTHKNYSNKQIAEKLNVPITNVEHWFRRDEYFSIPNADVWFQLKELLNITTDEFDAPITEFEEREGVFEQSNRVYHEDGVSPTIMSETNNGIVKILENEVKLVGGIGEKKSNGGTQYYQQNRVYSSDGVAAAHPASIPEGSYKYLVGRRIRKLTPLECLRLMNFDDDDYFKLREIESNTQMYSQAGNSIVVNVLVAIFGQMFEGKEEVYKNEKCICSEAE